MNTRLGVLTGGPCAGKTTVLQSVIGEWPDKMQVMPEIASALINSLVPGPGGDVARWLELFQETIVPTQKGAERMWQHRAQEMNSPFVLCDRGILDGGAYIPGGVKQLEELCGINAEQELQRYSFVIHLESVATANPALWDELKATNPARYETLDEAIEREMALRKVYEKHPNYFFIPGEKGIEDVIEQVGGILSDYLDVEVERKWLIRDHNPAIWHHLSKYPSCAIRQGYLINTDGVEIRVRQIGKRYFITIKGGKGITRKEWERPFPPGHFNELWALTAGHRVEKIRYAIPDHNGVLELDMFSNGNSGLVLVEREFASKQEAEGYNPPDWLKGAEEVTGNQSYYNRELAK